MTRFDNNSFEHDFILKCLEHLINDLKTDKSVPQLLDSKACQLTAFMQGKLVEMHNEVFTLREENDCLRERVRQLS